MANCSNIDLYDCLDFCKGQTVLPGLRDKVYYIPKSQIVTWPTLPSLDAENMDMAKIGTLSGNFVLASDAHWLSIDILTTASNIKFESQGDHPSRTFLNSATLKHAGNGPAAVGFCRMANADDLVYVLQQRDGSFRVLGNPNFDTDTKPAGDSGMAVTDASGVTLEVSVTDEAPAPYYTGTLSLDGATLNCETGVTTVGAGA